jgi:hypothetical protein
MRQHRPTEHRHVSAEFVFILRTHHHKRWHIDCFAVATSTVEGRRGSAVHWQCRSIHMKLSERANAVQDVSRSESVTESDVMAWHRALLLGHPDAPNVLARALVPSVIKRVRYQWLSSDDDVILQATSDAVLWYLNSPGRYDASIARLDVFLGMVASRRMQDTLKQRKRRARQEVGVNESTLVALANRRTGEVASDVGDDLSQRARLFALVQSDEERAFLEAYLASSGPDECKVGTPLTTKRNDRRIVQRLRQRASRQRMR